jgi:hypothetical protein
VVAAFEALGFSPTFDVEADPEFPGDGNWICPVVGYDRDGTVMEDFDSRWGAPVVLAVSGKRVDRWVGMFASGGLGGVTGAFGCPSPTDLCVLADGLAYLLDVTKPSRGAQPVHDQVTQVVPVEGLPLVLLVRFIDIVAIGQHGIAWRTPRLAVDGLQVVQADTRSIVCSCEMLGYPPNIELDPVTGEQTHGTRLSSFWPRGAL